MCLDLQEKSFVLKQLTSRASYLIFYESVFKEELVARLSSH